MECEEIAEDVVCLERKKGEGNFYIDKQNKTL